MVAQKYIKKHCITVFSMNPCKIIMNNVDKLIIFICVLWKHNKLSRGVGVSTILFCGITVYNLYMYIHILPRSIWFGSLIIALNIKRNYSCHSLNGYNQHRKSMSIYQPCFESVPDLVGYLDFFVSWKSQRSLTQAYFKNASINTFVNDLLSLYASTCLLKLLEKLTKSSLCTKTHTCGVVVWQIIICTIWYRGKPVTLIISYTCNIDPVNSKHYCRQPNQNAVFSHMTQWVNQP